MDVHRRQLVQILGAGALISAWPKGASAAPADRATTKIYKAPLDHSKPGGMPIGIPYIVVGKFDPSRRTVFILADGQQFYIREDVLGTYRSVFGPDVNVVGLGGRGSSKDLISHLGSPASADWVAVYEALRYEQWVHDVDLLRKQLVGPDHKILLYGVSGGGRLVHEYMTLHGSSVASLYTGSTVFQPLEAEFGLQADRFWRDLPVSEKRSLEASLSARPEHRDFYAWLLQRQNFFVRLEDLAAERRKLIAAIAADDRSALQDYAKRYQVAALQDLMKTPEAFRIGVREYEFIYPLLENGREPSEFLPDQIVSAMTARPLLELRAAGKIPAPFVDLRKLHSSEAEALLVAGRYDHVGDYRAIIALASHYPNHLLLLLNEDHQMQSKLGDQKALRNALIAAWTKGLSSADFRTALAAIEPLRWREAQQPN